jgi:hypothetical protein
LRTLIIIAQAVTGIEQAIIQMAARMQPAERRFCQIDCYRSAFAARARAANWSFFSQFPLCQSPPHIRFSC